MLLESVMLPSSELDKLLLLSYANVFTSALSELFVCGSASNKRLVAKNLTSARLLIKNIDISRLKPGPGGTRHSKNLLD